MHYKERLKDAPWFEKTTSVKAVVVGAGGIGSYLVYFLNRTGTDCYILDDDTLEAHNLGGQFYPVSGIGLPKLDVLCAQLDMYCPDATNNYLQRRFESDSTGYVLPITFSAVDSMASRMDIFLAWKSREDRKLFIDGRLGPDHYQVFTVVPGREDDYEASIVDDALIPDLPCTFKQTSHIAGMIAATMTNMYVNYLADFELPFKLEYFANPVHLTQA